MRNLEAKFPLPDIGVAQQQAEAIGFEYVGTTDQHDTFFVVANGKLKLRQQPGGACLIRYQRRHEEGLELSNYEIVAVPEPIKLHALLSAALGVLGEVHKRRVLLRRGNVRIHLDEVINRGFFGELEAVMESGDDPANYRAEIGEILTALQIPSERLIDVSYFELSG